MQNTPTPTVKVGDAVVFEVADAHEFQSALRDYGVHALLSKAAVTTPNLLEPWVVKVTGCYTLFGDIKVYETLVDLRGIRNADDLLLWVANMDRAFKQAADEGKR